MLLICLRRIEAEFRSWANVAAPAGRAGVITVLKNTATTASTGKAPRSQSDSFADLGVTSTLCRTSVTGLGYRLVGR